MARENDKEIDDDSRDGDNEDVPEIPENSDYSYFSTVQLKLNKEDYFERGISSKVEIDQMKEKMAQDVKRVREVMVALEKYLGENVNQMSINNKDFEITIPVDYRGMKFVTILSLTPQWIFVKCKVMDLEELNEKVRYELYERVLSSNFELNAVFYSVDPAKKGIWIENDLPASNLNIDNFNVHFKAIIFGIKYFWDNIATPLNQELKDTFKSPNLYT